MLHKRTKLLTLRQTDGRMIKALLPQPVKIAHRPVPGVAYQGEGKQPAQLFLRHQPFDIGQCGVLPQAPARLRVPQAAAALQRFRGIAQHHVPHVQRAAAALIRLTGPAGLSDMGQRVGAKVRQIAVEEGPGVGRAADADGVHHHKEGTGHQEILS